MSAQHLQASVRLPGVAGKHKKRKGQVLKRDEGRSSSLVNERKPTDTPLQNNASKFPDGSTRKKKRQIEWDTTTTTFEKVSNEHRQFMRVIAVIR